MRCLCMSADTTVHGINEPPPRAKNWTKKLSQIFGKLVRSAIWVRMHRFSAQTKPWRAKTAQIPFVLGQASAEWGSGAPAAKKQNKTRLVTNGCVIETGYWRRIPAGYWIDRWIHNGHGYIMDTGDGSRKMLRKMFKIWRSQSRVHL